MSIKELISEEEDAIHRIEEAKKKAEDIVADAKQETKKILAQAIQREQVEVYLKMEEDKTKKEAKKILEEFQTKSKELKKLSKKTFERTVDFVLTEALKVE